MLVDTCVWINHLRNGNPRLASSLQSGEVETHRIVIGELACGALRRREEILSLLQALPSITQAEHEEVLVLIEANRLHGCGLGWIDAHLLASVMISGTTLWTTDRRLADQARKLGVLFSAQG